MSNNMIELLEGWNFFFSGDELFSDSFPMVEKENFFYEITGKVKIIYHDSQSILHAHEDKE